jgi:hypothetical protein
MGAPDCANAVPVRTAASKALANIAGFIWFLPGGSFICDRGFFSRVVMRRG